VHDVLQSTEAEALHDPLQLASSWPAQAASNDTGVHFAVQPPDVSTLHCAEALTLMLPHDSNPACATRGAKNVKAVAAIEAARKRCEEVIGTISGEKSLPPVGRPSGWPYAKRTCIEPYWHEIIELCAHLRQ
jgi:hypothetical protein